MRAGLGASTLPLVLALAQLVAGCSGSSGGGTGGAGHDAGTNDAAENHDAADRRDHAVHDTGTVDSPAEAARDAAPEAGCALTKCGSGASAVCTDTQKDPDNCGRCGRSCLGGTCSSGACSVVTMVDPASGTAFEIARADTNGSAVVWDDLGPEAAFEVSTPGGTKIQLTPTTTIISGSDIAIGTGTNVALDADGPGLWYTATLGVSGGSVPQTDFGFNVMTYGLAWDTAGANVYMVTVDSYTSQSQLLVCNTSPPTTCSGPKATGGNIVGATIGVGKAGVAYADVANASIVVYDPGSGKSTTISGQTGLGAVAADASNVYFSTYDGTTTSICAVASGSTTVTTLFSGALSAGTNVSGLASDGAHLYFTANAGLYAIPTSGATTATKLDTATGGAYFGGVKYKNGAIVYFTTTGIYLLAAL